jgi:membrane protein YqaA with SNARE-associated domain
VIRRLLDWIETIASAWGGLGLFLIAFLDSSFLSFPQANDLLIVLMVVRNNPLMPYYAAMATLGSLVGCLVIYHLARKGGEAALRKRMKARSIERGTRLFQKYGLWALLIPAILPPPAPFKIFVLLAGVSRVPMSKFTLAIGLGRGCRYFGIGLLTLWYGEAAMKFIAEYGRETAIVLAALITVGAVLALWWRRRSAAAG